MVVDAKYVGAIIGQGGSSIREITKDSKAKCVVDIQKAVRDPLGNAEKVAHVLNCILGAILSTFLNFFFFKIIRSNLFAFLLRSFILLISRSRREIFVLIFFR